MNRTLSERFFPFFAVLSVLGCSGGGGTSTPSLTPDTTVIANQSASPVLPEQSTARDGLTNQPLNVQILFNDSVPINHHLYGINYEWNYIPAKDFAMYEAEMRKVTNYTLMRAPAGWNAEYYDWRDNSELPWTHYNPTTQPAGASLGTIADTVPEASFIMKSFNAIQDPDGLNGAVQHAVGHLKRFQGRVHLWEIGNEWYKMGDAAAQPSLMKTYARLVALEAPALKAVDPSITIYVNGDWTKPDQLAQLRQSVGEKSWASVDGIAVHAYCGRTAGGVPCDQIESSIQAIAAVTGKNLFYDSEWSVSSTPKYDPSGVSIAGLTIDALSHMAFARITAAAYWPEAAINQKKSLIDDTFTEPRAPGIAFGWMSKYYEGFALHTKGDLPAVAAKDGGHLNVIIPTGSVGKRTVQIRGIGVNQLIQSEVMWSTDPENPSAPVQVVHFPVSIRGGAASFVVNPGIPNRGAQQEIVHLMFANGNV